MRNPNPRLCHSARACLPHAAAARVPTRHAVSLVGSLLVVAALFTPAWSGTTGKLTGQVINEKNEPLTGVNIRVEGQRLGALSDETGHYVIIGVPAGSQTVTVNLLGHAAFRAEHVTILPDFTTTLDVAMKPEALQMAEVRVDAERPLLQRDATGTTRFLGGDDIQRMPTRGYRDAVALQTGVVNFRRQTGFPFFEAGAQNQPSLVVRGGRPNETAYFVDGISQQDPLTGTSSTAISNNAIDEVVVLTGGFSPEYGRIMSGAVNVITREGGGKYFGALETVTDNLSGQWLGGTRTDYNVYDLSLGGPVLPGRDNLTFFVSGERRWERDRSPSSLSDEYRQQLRDGTSYAVDPNTGTPVLSGRKFDDAFKPNNSSSVHTLQAKLAWRANDRITVRAGGLGSRDDWREYVHNLLFSPDRMPRHLDRNQSYFTTLTHALSSRSFYNLGVNYFETLSKTGDGVFFDDLTAYAKSYLPNPPASLDLDFPMFGVYGGVSPSAYLQRRSAYVGLHGDWTSQVTARHQLKVGGEFQRHTLRLITFYNPTSFGGPSPDYKNIDGYGYTPVVVYDAGGRVSSLTLEDVNGGRDGAKHPKTFSLFAQDKYERSGVTVNGGLRLDYINVDTPALRSDRTPLGDPADPGNLPDSLEDRDLESNHTYTRISPRLGVAFPVDERTILRFNYGLFTQQPNLRDLYVSYRYLQYLVRSHPYYVPLGNPNLRPERTTAYEVGFARQLADHVRFDVTTYYKDVKDLVEIVSVPNTSVSLYRNRDFATIKGIDLGFTIRPVRRLGANLAYSLSSAVGTGSTSTGQFRIAWLGGNVPKIAAPLDFDQRHKLAITLDASLEHGEGPVLGGRFRPLQDTHLNVVFNAASGTPYTPTVVYNEVGILVTAPRPIASLNSRYGPWSSSLDLKASRAFVFDRYRIEAYASVLNLFNVRNAIQVYQSSGSPNSTDWLSTPDGQAYLQAAAGRGADGEALYHLAERNPNFYLNPRLVRLGLRASF